MNCKIADLRNKQVVCVKNGCVLGYVYDVEFNTAERRFERACNTGQTARLGAFRA